MKMIFRQRIVVLFVLFACAVKRIYIVMVMIVTCKKNKRNRQKVSKNRETERPTGPFPLFPKATTQFPDSQSSEMIGKVRAPTGLAYICTEAIGGCLRLQ